VTLLCPAIRMIVKASARDSPGRVNIVCLNECITNSEGAPKKRAKLIVLMIDRRHEDRTANPIYIRDKNVYTSAGIAAVLNQRPRQTAIRHGCGLPGTDPAKLTQTPYLGRNPAMRKSH
jgi:hypothetical protein